MEPFFSQTPEPAAPAPESAPAAAAETTEEVTATAEMPPGFLFKVNQHTEKEHLNCAEHSLYIYGDH